MTACWGWRSILVCIYVMVLVTACGTENQAPPQHPTEPPPITLTVRTRNSIPPPTATSTPQITTSLFSVRRTPALYSASRVDTLESLSQDFGIDAAFLQTANPVLDFDHLTTGTQVIIPNLTSTPIALEIRPPLCTALTTDQLLCIGEVYNPHSFAVENVALQFTFIEVTQGLLYERTPTLRRAFTEVEGRYILPQTAAPYRVQFYAREPYQELVIEPIGLNYVTVNLNTSRLTEVKVHGTAVLTTEERYFMQVTLKNEGEIGLADLRVIISVYDETDQLIGFRTYDVEKIAPSESLDLGAQISLLRSSQTSWHSVSIFANTAK